MAWREILLAVWLWIVAAQVPLILALIAVDLVTGVAAALAGKEFSWYRLGKFYQTNVAPYLLTYLLLRALVGLVLGLEGLLGEGIVGMAFATIVYNLVASIVANLQCLKLDVRDRRLTNRMQ